LGNLSEYRQKNKRKKIRVLFKEFQFLRNKSSRENTKNGKMNVIKEKSFGKIFLNGRARISDWKFCPHTTRQIRKRAT
jgi:hypothetical protein